VRHANQGEFTSNKEASHEQGLKVGRSKECMEEWAEDAQALGLLLEPHVLTKYLLVSPHTLPHS